jgi:hypothetical protein
MVNRIEAVAVGLLTALLIVAALSLTSSLVLSQARLKTVITSGFASGGGLTQYDRWVECVNFTMEYVRHEEVILDALDTRWIRPEHHTCDELQALVAGPPYSINFAVTASYVSYPSGARHLMAIPLSVLSISATKALYRFFSYASVVALFFSAWWNRPRLAVVIIAPVALLLLFAFEQHRFSNDTMWAPAFFVGFIALSVFLVKRRWFQDSANRLGFFCFLGVVVGYFEYLHGPLPVILSLTIVLDYFFYAAYEKDCGWFAVVRNAITILFCFVLGFGLLTVVRLELLNSVLYYSVWQQFLLGLGARLSNTTADYPNAHVTDIFHSLWTERREITGSTIASTAILFSGACAWILSAVLVVAPRAGARVAAASAKNTGIGIFVLAIAGGGILAWYVLFPNHTIIHAFMMGRMLALPVAYGFSALILSLIQWRETRYPRRNAAK